MKIEIEITQIGDCQVAVATATTDIGENIACTYDGSDYTFEPRVCDRTRNEYDQLMMAAKRAQRTVRD